MSHGEAESRLCELLMDVFLIEEKDVQDAHGPDEIETWDSLATVAMAVGLDETFGHHMTPEEVAEIRTIGDIKTYLRKKGVAL